MERTAVFEKRAGGTGGIPAGRRLLLLLLSLLFLLPVSGNGEAAMTISAPAEVIRPGLTVIIHYTLPEAGECDVVLRSDAGEEVSVVSKGHYAYAGANTIHWNGTYNGAPAPEGSWRLCLEKDGRTAETRVQVGPMAPCLVGVSPLDSVLISGTNITVQYYATSRGSLKILLADGEEREELAGQETGAGDGTITFPLSSTAGQHTLAATLTDGEGIRSEEYYFTVTVIRDPAEETPAPEAPAGAEATPTESGKGVDKLQISEETEAPPRVVSDTVYTPSHTSPYEGLDSTANYWTTPMDITDEEAVWTALTAPITVIDNGKGEKAQIILRSAPDQESDGLGVVTCETQGVHVLERGEEWSLIECYSSSFHDSKILNWNALVQGYVQTSYLKEIKPNQEMGLVIDKLTQRLYLFREGKLFTTLLVSTGIANARQPYNETRSGEFLMTSKVGTFASDNMKCAMAIRFNSGDLLHEVPYLLNRDGTPNYNNNEPKLGTKASHGCIRVQRKKTPEDVNMKWIWKALKNNSRVRLLIWEDWQGRQIPIPADDTLVYYNPNKGQFYHSQEKCNSARPSVVFESFHYSELDTEPYSKLKRCEYCTPPLRRAEIEAINEQYAEGGDHDPVLTEARKSCPKPLGKK